MIANAIMVLAMIIITLGFIGVLPKKNLFLQMVSVSLIDTIGFILLAIALMIKAGFSAMFLKIIIIVGFVLLTNPIVNHLICNKAYEASQNEARKEL